MALKVEIEQWHLAVSAYDDKDYATALQIFQTVPSNAKILFNLGVLHSKLGNHKESFECIEGCLALDKFLAVAHFQKAVENFHLQNYDAAQQGFKQTFGYMRGNQVIDYSQLGLNHKMYLIEIRFNRALALNKKGDTATASIECEQVKKLLKDYPNDQVSEGLEDFENAKLVELPFGAIFRPIESKVKNTKKVDYLGKAKVVSAAGDQNTSTGFQGAEKKKAEEEAKSAGMLTPSTIEASRASTTPISDMNYKSPEFDKMREENRKSMPALESKSNNGYPSANSSFSMEKNDIRKRAETIPDMKSQNRHGVIGSGNGLNYPVPPRPVGSAPFPQPGLPSNGMGAIPSHEMKPKGKGSQNNSSKLRNEIDNSKQDSQLPKARPPPVIPPGRMKVKCHYTQTFVLAMSSNSAYPKILSRIRQKFNNQNLMLKYRDEDNDWVSIVDQGDLDIARGFFGGDSVRSNKLEVWCYDPSKSVINTR